MSLTDRPLAVHVFDWQSDYVLLSQPMISDCDIVHGGADSGLGVS